MNRSSRVALALGCIAMLAALAACGGDSAAITSGGTPTTAPRTAPATTATAAAPPRSAATPTIEAAQPSATTQAPPPAAVGTPTAAPTSAPPPPTQAPPLPAAQSLTVIAKGVKFVPNALSAAAGATLHLTLDNQDDGVTHDIVIYAPSGAKLAASDAAAGPIRQPLTLEALAAGRYAFKCSVHPQTMTGTIAVQ
jgi:plastocyanin